MEFELDALELLTEEQGLTGGCDMFTCGIVSCLPMSCGFISCGYATHVTIIQ